MNKQEKLQKFINPDVKDILLSDFLAPRQVQVELVNFLHVNSEKDLLDLLGVDIYYHYCLVKRD